jgi:uncharacterized protein YuzB (UPF0349 family)
MRETIECCIANTSESLQGRLTRSEVDVANQYCLQRCWLCHSRSFVIVNGEVVVEETEAELEERLEARDDLASEGPE